MCRCALIEDEYNRSMIMDGRQGRPSILLLLSSRVRVGAVLLAWLVGGWKWEILSTTSKEKLFKNRGGNRGGTQERAWYGDVAASSHHKACRTRGQKSRVKRSPYLPRK